MAGAMSTELALSVENLSRRFSRHGLRPGDQRGLSGVSLGVPKGSCFGFVGPNGAGKTTFIKIVLGLIRAESGSVTILGSPQSDPRWKARIGYLPEQPYFYDHLSAAEYLDLVGRLFGLAADVRRKRSDDLMERLGLASSAKVRMRKYSKGMMQRLGVAQALMNDPDFVILDEPMSGLDPIGRRDLRELFLELRDKGKTLFFSSHILSDVETLCDGVALMRGGKLVASGPLDQVLQIDAEHMELTVALSAVEGALREFPRVSLGGDRHRFDVSDREVFRVLDEVRRARGRVVSMHPVRKSLEDFFVENTRSAR
jgi:ABC-2 type transport system ATP-binding protein